MNHVNKRGSWKKKMLPFLGIGAAAVVGVTAAAQTATGRKVVDYAAMQRALKRFNNFDLTKVLETVPSDKELTALAEKSVSKIELTPVFNEATVTKAEISALLSKYSSAPYSWDKSAFDKLPDKVDGNDKLKHLFNNILSLCHNEDGTTADIYASDLIELFDKIDPNYDKKQVDIICRLFKQSYSWSPVRLRTNELGNLLNNPDLIKIAGLNEYLKKNCPNIAKSFSMDNFISYKADASFSEYANFIKALRKGNVSSSGSVSLSNFDFKIAAKFLNSLNDDSIKLMNLGNIDEIFKNKEMSPKALSKKLNDLSADKIKFMYTSGVNFNTFFDFEDFIGIKNINELDAHQKRDLMRKLVKNNTDTFGHTGNTFPILPRSKDEYCALLQKLSKSIGIGVQPLTQAQIATFEKTINSLASTIADVDLNHATLTLKMSREDFVAQIEKIIGGLKDSEKNKVMDYFGFEIKDGKLIGYPLNVNNGAKLKEIESNATRKIVEKVRPIVEEFSSNANPVKITGCAGADALEKDLNQLFEAFPELRSIIGRQQHVTHAFSLDIHTLKVLQNVCSNPKFEGLSESDKKIIEISALLHDITKIEGQRDITHPFESAFDAYYIIQKLNLPETDQLKVYQLIKTHNWLNRLNNPKNKDMIQNIAQDVAFDARHTNTFELAKILCEADLKSVKKDDAFFRQHQKTLDEMSALVDGYVKKLHQSQIVLPQTRIPKASQVTSGQVKSANGVTNTVIYMDKASDNLSAYGFDENTTKDNFLALVHALDREEQLRKFDTFSTIDTEALLSSSYIKTDDYRVFRNQGLILDVAYDDIHAGYYHDFGTGYSKDIELLKQDYLFLGERKDIGLDDNQWRGNRTEYRKYISGLVKKQLGLSDTEYMEYMEKIKDCKSITDIEQVDKTFADGLMEVFKNMQSGKRRGGRSYNEMLVTRPQVQGVFAYDKSYESIPLFLRKYAQDNDLPIIIFGKK